jgi:hypothetical protein
MEIPKSNIKFVCGLSNGETLVEGRGVLESFEGEKSSWWKLQDYIEDRDLTIQSFGLWTGDRHYNLPSVDPKFKGRAPTSYNCFRKYGQNILMGQGNVEHYICAEAIYEDYKIQIWIDEQDINKMWCEIQDVGSDKKQN